MTARAERTVPPPIGPHSGVVSKFDEAAGYGELRDESGNIWWFHCTGIADGSRSIGHGAPVVFSLVAGRLGVWEAVAIVT